MIKVNKYTERLKVQFIKEWNNLTFLNDINCLFPSIVLEIFFRIIFKEEANSERTWKEKYITLFKRCKIASYKKSFLH